MILINICDCVFILPRQLWLVCICIYHGYKIYLNLKPKMLCTILPVSHKCFDYYYHCLDTHISVTSDVWYSLFILHANHKKTCASECVPAIPLANNANNWIIEAHLYNMYFSPSTIIGQRITDPTMAFYVNIATMGSITWRNGPLSRYVQFAGYAFAGNAGEVFPAVDFKDNH